MATEKQIRANRENAKKSKGPKTAAGRARSSRNALRHGLSLPLALDTEIAVSEQAKPTQVAAAIEFAHAQLDLGRIRAVRGQMMADLDFVSGDLTHLRRLVALDRYEGRALARRYYASSKLVT